ncbi:aminotransferase class I/II-fold pyridoxal phosphate-dependent enzyme [Pararhodospirillum oryzae]|uniref:Aminotransferase n=1 Tax=Pararhodospirillum oryzae TaxID=478448 RepID=A0A512H5P8_9PROT|nr:aminotransferase class I/II-fold pyridoxal phosphate-dependent enzyme [Pararhodospirillum oryzae]GEO80758.1 threonine-phosphate decarboxylase [Pararhodospirillum oryzae]
MTDRLLWHGGALDEATARFGDPGPAGWLDLSTGIAPRPYPFPPVPPTAWTRLPQAADEALFLDTVRRVHRVPAAAGLAALPGEQGVLPVLADVGAPAGEVVVPDPGYGGHAEAWTLAGRPVNAVPDPLAWAGRAAVVVLINPNNPTGQTWPVDRVLDAATRQAQAGGWLIVDEAFAEVTPGISVLPWAGRPGLVVLRSLGKFFGLPGARLGWLAGPPGLEAAVARRLGPWAVSGPALFIGRAAEGNALWRRRQRLRLDNRRRRLDGVLAGAGFTLAGGTSLFRYVEVPAPTHAHDWFNALARRGILVRAFAGDATHLRVGLPPDRQGLSRLARALAETTARP